MISVSEALKKIVQNQPERQTEHVSLMQAHMRTLSEDIISKTARPPEAVSAMDGYAVRLSDVQKANAQLSVIGEAPAGRPFGGSVSAGEAVRIFTGGVVPSGADHIVIQEDCERLAGKIHCAKSYKQPRHIRPKGLDFQIGDVILPAGRQLSALDISLAASANINELPVLSKLNIALIANGSELKPPGSSLNQGDVINSNVFGLTCMLNAWGAQSIDLGIAEDSVAAIQRKISSAPDNIDIFVTVGGASVGDHDHARRAFFEIGFDPIFEKVAVKPGKPTWLAIKDKQLVLGLPGNPASALVCAHLFLKPLVTTSTSHGLVKAQTLVELASNGPRETFLRGSVKINEQGLLIVEPMRMQDSSLLTPFAQANCLIRRLPNEPETPVGAYVDILATGPFLST